MQGNFVGLLAFGIIVLLLAMLFTWWASVSMAKPREKMLTAVVAIAMVAIGALLLGISWYNGGQLNKRLPDLKRHGCAQVIHLEYRLGEDSRTEISQLLKASRDSRCKGSIVVQYPNNPAKTVVLK